MFTVVEDSLAREIEANARTRGATTTFFNNLENWYNETWSKDKANANRPCVIFLTGDGAPFAGKKPESVYSSLIQNKLYKNELKNKWRLIRKDGQVAIAHL